MVQADLPIERPTGPRYSEQEILRIRVLASALVVLGTGSLIGVSFSPYLVNHFPLLLVGLSPLGRHLILVAPITQPAAFVSVVLTRRVLFYSVCFQLGHTLGDPALAMIEDRFRRLKPFVRFLERIFTRWSHLVVVFLPGPLVSTLAGISGMSFRVFLGLSVGGMFVRLCLVVAFAEWAREPIEQILAFLDRNWREATALMISGVAIQQLWRRYAKRRREHEV